MWLSFLGLSSTLLCYRQDTQQHLTLGPRYVAYLVYLLPYVNRYSVLETACWSLVRRDVSSTMFALWPQRNRQNGLSRCPLFLLSAAPTNRLICPPCYTFLVVFLYTPLKLRFFFFQSVEYIEDEKKVNTQNPLQAVQQFKNGRKRKANRALNPKRSEIFGVKSNCGTASLCYNP